MTERERESEKKEKIEIELKRDEKNVKKNEMLLTTVTCYDRKREI